MTISRTALTGTTSQRPWPYLEGDKNIENLFNMGNSVTSPSIALVHEGNIQPIALQNHIEMLGGKTTSFGSLEELLSRLRHGNFFDSIILLTPNTVDIERLRAAKNLSDAPIFLVTEDRSFDSARQENEIFFRLKHIVFTPFISDQRTLALRLFLLTTQVLSQPGFESRVWGDYCFRTDGNTVMCKGEIMHLKPKEFLLALEFFRNLGRLLTKEQLISGFYSGHKNKDSRGVDVCVCNIRKKLQLHEANGFVLQTIYARGYQLVAWERPEPN